MLTINLISQQLKDQIKLRHIYVLSRRINHILALTILVAAITMLASKSIMQNGFHKIVSDTTLVTLNSQSYNSKVRDINLKFRTVSRIQEDYMPWSYLLESIAGLTPPGIVFSSLKMSKDGAGIAMTGHAKRRSDLLGFKESLEADDIFSDIEFPLKNIMQKEDINFEIKARLDLNRLKSNIDYDIQ